MKQPDLEFEWVLSGPDAQPAYRFWYENYVERQGLFRSVADHARRELRDGDDRHARVLIARHAGRVVGTVRVCIGADGPLTAVTVEDFALAPFVDAVGPERQAVVSRLIVDPALRGTAAPVQILTEVVRRTVGEVDLYFGDCELHLVNLYARLGLRTYGHLLNHPTSGLLVPMVLVSGDLGHLDRVRSPMLPLFAGVEHDPTVLDAVRPLVHGAPPVVLTEQLVGVAAFAEAVRGIVDAHELRRSMLFRDLSPDEVTRLVKRAHIVECRPGDALIRKDHVSKTLYAVLSGTVDIRVDGRLVGAVPAGSAVGEIAFFLDQPRTADVIARDAVRVLCLNNRVVEGLLAEESAIAARLLLNMTRALCQKIERTTTGEMP